MEAQKQPSHAHRYLAAVLVIIVFVVAAVVAQPLVTFVVNAYLPQFSVNLVVILEAVNFTFALVGTYLVYCVLLSIILYEQRHGRQMGSTEVSKKVLKTAFVIVAVILAFVIFGPALGLTLSESLAGGAIGGVIIGLAVQTVATSILSGFLVSSSKTVVKGDLLIMHSSLWGGDIVCRIVKVNVLFTELITQNGTQMRVPNTTLLSATTFTKLRNDGRQIYAIQAQVNNDVPLGDFESKVKAILQNQAGKKRIPEFYLSNRGASANTYTIVIEFDDFSQINRIIDSTNRAFDTAYWQVKNKPQKK